MDTDERDGILPVAGATMKRPAAAWHVIGAGPLPYQKKKAGRETSSRPAFRRSNSALGKTRFVTLRGDGPGADHSAAVTGIASYVCIRSATFR